MKRKTGVLTSGASLKGLMAGVGMLTPVCWTNSRLNHSILPKFDLQLHLDVVFSFACSIGEVY